MREKETLTSVVVKVSQDHYFLENKIFHLYKVKYFNLQIS